MQNPYLPPTSEEKILPGIEPLAIIWLIIFVAGNVYGFNEWGFEGILVATSTWMVGTYLINRFKLRSFHPITKFTFSAIELIVVLCILAVLYGLMQPARKSLPRRERQPQQVPTHPTSTFANRLVNAVKLSFEPQTLDLMLRFFWDFGPKAQDSLQCSNFLRAMPLTLVNC